jgi:hypothetical protein
MKRKMFINKVESHLANIPFAIGNIVSSSHHEEVGSL